MKLTKTKLKQIIKEALNELEDWEPPEGDYKEGSFVEVEISDDGYDKNVEIVEDPHNWKPTHGMYVGERFLAKIVKVSTKEYED